MVRQTSGERLNMPCKRRQMQHCLILESVGRRRKYTQGMIFAMRTGDQIHGQSMINSAMLKVVVVVNFVSARLEYV
jgi:hypothetical protein